MVNYSQEEHNKFYVEFEQRPKVDRVATEKEGHPVFKDVDFVIITMPGGNTVVEKKVTDDLVQEWKHGTKTKPPAKFALNSYEAWKEGLDAPLEGTDLKNWPGVTPAQLKQCQGANIRTVEDLATCSADGQKRLGMGGVALIKKAKAYLDNAQDNKGAERIAALEKKLESLVAQIEKKDKEIAELSEMVNEATEPPKRTRRKRNPETGELE